ncbi:sugar porter family MFS transporter [Providencia burhodogranariea]|uniref:D-xylose-proton symporter n=1 Tax=Providencia burhodogranariea DSM 19968 TaxID=1141662 RepID=K8W859_9GAMM|nr:sugar porter family MFS transporter [Providencia burhodogranariea]EKT56041.1 sugar transporter [Providencia burhodogranariea DSM 19968]
MTNSSAQLLKMRNIWVMCLVAACGGLLFGYDWVVIGGAKPFYEAYFNITDPALIGWAMSSALVGCILGAILSGTLSDRYGRKLPLILAAILFGISALGTAITSSFDHFIWFRILGGIAIGIASALSPIYIAEISPSEQRGRFVAVNQLTIVIGVLAAQIINLLIAEPVATGSTLAEIATTWNGQSGWRYMFAAQIIPSVIFFVLMLFMPESPRWLIKVGKESRARETLLKIGNAHYADKTVSAIKQSMGQESAKVPFSAIFAADVRPIMVIGIVLAIFQQWCGINVIFNYAQEIFASAGFDINDTLKSIVATGIINLIFTVLALPLVDKLGRRKLMLIGSAGLCIIYILIALAYSTGTLGIPVLALVLAAISVYAMTLAPVTWVLLSEIFPNRIRGIAMSVATLALWIACFALTYSFPLLNANLGASGSFLLYGVICLIGFAFVFKRVPETKGVSLEELENRLISNK